MHRPIVYRWRQRAGAKPVAATAWAALAMLAVVAALPSPTVSALPKPSPLPTFEGAPSHAATVRAMRHVTDPIVSAGPPFVRSAVGTAEWNEDVAAPQPSSALLPVPVVATPTPVQLANPVAIGAYVHGAPWSSGPRQAFEQLLGRTLAIVMWYQPWGSGGASAFDPALMERASEGGAMPMLTWVPDSSAPVAFNLRQVVAGDHDAYLRRFAHAAATWGRPFMLRPMHEMNGDWQIWSPGIRGNTTDEYVAAWRHLHDIFVSEGATKVRWVWSPNTYVERTGISFVSIYPGDAYVDWVGLDGYNNGTAQSWSSWTTFTQEFGASYESLIRLTRKPLMIAEVASCEAGGNKGDWIRSALLDEIPSRFDRVRALVWFNEDKECDWRINSSDGALAAMQAAARSSAYAGAVATP